MDAPRRYSPPYARATLEADPRPPQGTWHVVCRLKAAEAQARAAARPERSALAVAELGAARVLSTMPPEPGASVLHLSDGTSLGLRVTSDPAGALSVPIGSKLTVDRLALAYVVGSDVLLIGWIGVEAFRARMQHATAKGTRERSLGVMRWALWPMGSLLERLRRGGSLGPFGQCVTCRVLLYPAYHATCGAEGCLKLHAARIAEAEALASRGAA